MKKKITIIDKSFTPIGIVFLRERVFDIRFQFVRKDF